MMLSIRKALIAGSFAAAAISAPVVANHSWDGVHWPRSSGSELRVPVGDNVGAQWDNYLHDAVRKWNKSTVIQSPVVAGKTHPAKCRLVPGTIQACNAAYGTTGWLGLASISLSNGHLSAAVARLNDTYFNTATFNTPGWRQYVTCHEIGHTYGLAHQDEVFDNPNLGTCLDVPAVVTGNEGPNTHDYDMLLSIYDHAESAMVAMNSGTSSGFETGDTPKEWGRAVKFDRLGRPIVFIRIVSPTERIITDVIWAPGEGPRGRF